MVNLTPAIGAVSDDQTLIVALVIDADTDEPIESFRYFAGTSWLDWTGWQWQPHTVQKGEAGELIWPPLGRGAYDLQVVRIEAEGYVAYVTAPFGQKPGHPVPGEVLELAPGKPHTLTIRLHKDRGLEGYVLAPGGEPAAGARVGITRYMRGVTTENGRLVPIKTGPPAPHRLWPEAIVVEADSRGRFRVHNEAGPAAIAVTHPTGFALVDIEKFEKGGDIQLEPWASVQGKVAWQGISPKGVVISVGGSMRLAQRSGVNVSTTIEVDEEGNFRINSLPSGMVSISRKLPDGSCSSFGHPHQSFNLGCGERGKVVYGGKGRSVVGRLPAGLDCAGVTVRYDIEAPAMGFLRGLEPGECSPWNDFRAFLDSELGQLYKRPPTLVDADGTFRFDGVLPERYQLFIDKNQAGKKTLIGGTSFQIETLDGGVDQNPLDLGELQVRDLPLASTARSETYETK